MTVMTNGRARKSLSEQIDRLDKVLDGLAEGLNEAIASAVQEAVRTVLKEVLAQQEIVARLQGENAGAKATKTTLTGRIAGVCRQGWTWVKGFFGSAGQKVATVAAMAGQSFVGAVKTVNATVKKVRDQVVGGVAKGLAGLWLLRRLASSSTVVFALGFALGVAVAFTGVWVLAIVGGVRVCRWLQQPVMSLFRVG